MANYYSQDFIVIDNVEYVSAPDTKACMGCAFLNRVEVGDCLQPKADCLKEFRADKKDVIFIKK